MGEKTSTKLKNWGIKKLKEDPNFYTAKGIAFVTSLAAAGATAGLVDSFLPNTDGSTDDNFLNATGNIILKNAVAFGAGWGAYSILDKRTTNDSIERKSNRRAFNRSFIDSSIWFEPLKFGTYMGALELDVVGDISGSLQEYGVQSSYVDEILHAALPIVTYGSLSGVQFIWEKRRYNNLKNGNGNGNGHTTRIDLLAIDQPQVTKRLENIV